MGNYRFRFSDMIPNAWFYKLKDMSSHNTKNHPNHHHKSTKKKSHPPSSPIAPPPPPNNHPPEITKLPHLSDQRKSYYFTRDLTFHPNSPPPEPPRRSSRRRRSRLRNRQPEPRLVSSTTTAGCSCRATLESVWTHPPPGGSQTSSSDDHGSTLTEHGSDRGLIPDDASDDVMLTSCKCRASGNDAVNIEMDGNYSRISDELDHHDLPPIITKKQHHEPTKIRRRTSPDEETAYGSLSVKVVKENFSSPACRRPVSGNSSLSPGGVKLRKYTPRIANRRIQGRKSVSSTGGSRQSVSESFAVVKSSKDPGRDFKESMVEMIVENNIRASKDLEELLACYLSLNSDEYHELIINVFKQIWFDFTRFRLN